MLRNVLRYSALWCNRALIMPNTKPPVLGASEALSYHKEIMQAQEALPEAQRLTPLMTIQITPHTHPTDIALARSEAGVVAGKVYPRGMTTNSENGVLNYEALYDVFGQMEEVGMVLSLHGEHPGEDVFCLDREERFLEILQKISYRFPRLKIVLEHVTTAKATETVLMLPDTVAATITVHHLILTLDNVIGHMLKPHHFCKPVAKRPGDRDALLRVAMSGRAKFFLGTDSAPHPRGAKECADGCAGIFTAPVALPLLATLFEGRKKLEALEKFTSVFGAQHYGLPLTQELVTLVKEEWQVPHDIDGVVPFMAGETLAWKVYP